MSMESGDIQIWTFPLNAPPSPCSWTENASIIIVVNNPWKCMRRNRRVSQVYRWGAASAVGERI